MNINFKLDFFYYQEQLVLDGEDPKMEELNPHIEKFSDFLTIKSLDQIIELFTLTYTEKYAQTQFWTMRLLARNSYRIKLEYPSYLDENIDIYLASNIIKRNDIKHFICKMKDDPENNCYYSEYMEFLFIQEQDTIKFKEAVERSLQGKQYSVSQLAEIVTYNVSDSPIASIEISSTKVKMIMNSDKWIAYPGLS